MMGKKDVKFRKIVAPVLIAILSFSALYAQTVKAESGEPIYMDNGGTTIIFPQNTTYNINLLDLEVNFVWSRGTQPTLNYSLDDKWEGPISLSPPVDDGLQMVASTHGSAPLPPLPQGSHRLTVFTEADTTGQPPNPPFQPKGDGGWEANWVQTVYFTIDTAGKPIISSGGAFTMYQPLNITYSSSPATLNMGFECFMGGYLLQYDIDGKHQGTIPYTVQRSNETHIEYPATGSVNLPPLPEGTHSVTIYMSGVRNTTYTATVYFTVESSGKLTPPTISNLSIKAATTYNTTDLALQFTTNENIAQETYSLDGNSNVTIDGNTTLTGLADGAHDIILYVQDNSGNVASQAVHFTVEVPKTTEAAQTSKPLPTPSVTAYPSAWVAVGITGALAVAFLSIALYTHQKRVKATVNQQPK